MSGFAHPTVSESLRNFPVTPSDFARILGNPFCTIRALDRLQFKVGERVNVCDMGYMLNDNHRMFCARYIVAIRPILPLLSDENLMEYDLNVFNESEL